MKALLLTLPAAALLTIAPPLLSDGADLIGADGLAAALSGVGTAEAQFWVKPNRTSTTWGSILHRGKTYRFTGDQAPSNTSVSTTVELVDHGLLVPTSGGAAEDARVRFEATVTPDAGPYVVALEYGDTPLQVSVGGLAFSAGKAAMVMTELGMTVRLAATDESGGVRLVFTNEDPNWNPADLGAVTLSDGSGPVSLGERSTDLTYTTSFDWTGLPSAEELAGGRVLVTSTLLDADGAPIDSQVEMETAGQAVEAVSIRKLRISETNRGHAKATFFVRVDPLQAAAQVADRSADASAEASADVAVVEDPSAEAPSEASSDTTSEDSTEPLDLFAEAVITDNQSGEVLLDELALSPKGVERQFVFGDLTFSDPAVGEEFTVVIDLMSDENLSVGTVEAVVPVGDADATESTPLEVLVDGEPVAGTIAITQLGSGQYEVAISLLSEAVSSVNLAFYDYFDNEPSPTDLSIGLTAEWSRWVAKGNAGIGSLGSGGDVTVEVTILDGSGAVLDVAGGGADDVPGLLFSFGSGTTNAASATSAKPQLL